MIGSQARQLRRGWKWLEQWFLLTFDGIMVPQILTSKHTWAVWVHLILLRQPCCHQKAQPAMFPWIAVSSEFALQGPDLPRLPSCRQRPRLIEIHFLHVQARASADCSPYPYGTAPSWFPFPQCAAAAMLVGWIRWDCKCLKEAAFESGVFVRTVP